MSLLTQRERRLILFVMLAFLTGSVVGWLRQAGLPQDSSTEIAESATSTKP